MSDLHLEVGQQYAAFDFPVTAPHLILAGDIGRLIDYDAYLQFLARQTARYKRVFLVLGNHEFYGMTFDAGISTAQKLAQEPLLEGRLTLLHRERQDVADGTIAVLGCTLWSRIPEDAADTVRGRVKDFQKIKDWGIEDHNEAHETDLSWLRCTLDSVSKEGSGKAIIVVTHHAPSILETSRPEHLDNSWTCAFATDLLDGSSADWGHVQCWIYGHTHYSTDFKKENRLRVVSNQRGYVLPGTNAPVAGKGDPGKHTFDATKTIRVDIRRER